MALGIGVGVAAGQRLSHPRHARDADVARRRDSALVTTMLSIRTEPLETTVVTYAVPPLALLRVTI